MTNCTEHVNHPKHYNQHASGVECIDIAENMNFNLGNAFKYVFRAGYKSDDSVEKLEKAIEDLEKAKWYLNREKSRDLPRFVRKHEIAPSSALDNIVKVVSFEMSTRGIVLMSIWNCYYSGSLDYYTEAIKGIDKMIGEIKCL